VVPGATAGEYGGLLDRRAELDALRAAAAGAARGSGRAVVVEGPAGIGKTALVAAARALALDAGLRPLAARGSEIERAFGFGVVRQLLEPSVEAEAASRAFTGSAAFAAPLLGVHVADAPPLPIGPEGVSAVVHGLYRLTANLARATPLALTVDDAHWADTASLRFLAYLAARLDDLPVLVVVAARPLGEPGGAAIDALLGEDRTTVRPRALGEAASASLVRAALPDADDVLCRTCHALTGGNPFFLRELAGALHEVGPERAGEVLGAAPSGVVAAIGSRLSRFDEPARKLAGALAILGDSAPLRHAAAIAGLESDVALEAADTLRAGRILADDDRLAYLHPIIRTAVREQLSGAARSSGHLAAARLLADEDAAAERVAAHLLFAEPAASEWVCECLRQAAREALPRGAADASVTYLRRALEEPPPRESRPAVLLEMGLAEALMLDFEPAIEHLRRGVETTGDTPARLFASRMLSSLVGMNDAAAGVEIVERALAASGDADPALRTQIEAHLTNIARFDLATRVRSAPLARRVLEGVESGALNGPIETAVAALEGTMAGMPAERTAELARRAIAGLRGDPQLAITLSLAARCLAIADRIDEAIEVLTAAVNDARRFRATYRLGPFLMARAEARLRAGALASAASDAHDSLTVYGSAGRMGMIGGTAWWMRALVELGELDAADAALDACADSVEGALGESLPGTWLLHARAELRLARGDAEGALEDLLECGRREAIAGDANPALVEWRSRAAVALARLGRPDDARRLADEELELARRFGTLRAIGIALTALGRVEQGEPGQVRLREAVETLEGSPARLEHARALTHLGIALRRGRHIAEAREPLRRALDLADRCGAQPLAKLAGDELRIAGGRPRRARIAGAGALTTNERRVAGMAADGHSNVQIADALYVSRKTVEKHLSSAYRKLNVHAREELPRALTEDAQDR
jgi:DNA-binding CsgD family transcriptional regulator